MKEISSLPKGSELNINVTLYKNTALKLDNPTLILSKRHYLRKLAYYISFGRYKDMTNESFIGKIIYYDKSGCDFFSEYYRLDDEDYVLHTRFVQLIERVIQIN